MKSIVRLLLTLAILAILAVDYAALDDITTGTETSFAAEWTWLVLSTPFLCLLGWALFRHRRGRPQHTA